MNIKRMFLNLLYSKETVNLMDINKLARLYNKIISHDDELQLLRLIEIKKAFLRIDTKEHKEKVNLYLSLINITL
jgi:hypothetical protein